MAYIVCFDVLVIIRFLKHDTHTRSLNHLTTRLWLNYSAVMLAIFIG